MSAVDTGSEKFMVWIILVRGKEKSAWDLYELGTHEQVLRKVLAHEDTSIAPDYLPIIDFKVLLQEVDQSKCSA